LAVDRDDCSFPFDIAALFPETDFYPVPAIMRRCFRPEGDYQFRRGTRNGGFRRDDHVVCLAFPAMLPGGLEEFEELLDSGPLVIPGNHANHLYGMENIRNAGNYLPVFFRRVLPPLPPASG
jgi:hypothetical protein